MRDQKSKAVHVETKLMNTSNELRNPYPDSFGYLRIGTPVNVDISRPNVYGAALDMGMLNGANLLRVNANPTIIKEIQGSGFDEKAQNAWGASVSLSGGYKGSFLDISAEFHCAAQHNISTSSAVQYVMARSTQKSGISLIDNPSQTQIYQCGTDGFREAIDAIVSAVNDEPVDPSKVLTAINEFYRLYGTGFISKLELGALGVFEGKAQYASKSTMERLDLGGSLSVSGFVGGASAAADFCSQKIAQNAVGTFSAGSFGVPVGSVSEIWASGYVDAFSGAQLQKLGRLEAWSAAFNMNIPAPNPPQLKQRPPHPESMPTIPSGRVEDIEGAIRKMQLDAFAKDYAAHHDGQSPSPNEYSIYLDKLRQDSLVNISQINLVEIPPVDPAAPVNPHVQNRSIRVHPGYFQELPHVKDSAAVGGQPEFGGYAVTGFDYKPWSAVLPFLKDIEQALSGTQVSLGLALVWLSIRQMMGQYLMYCSRYEELAPEGTDVAAYAYLQALQEISNKIVEELKEPTSDWWDPSMVLKNIESSFQDILHHNKFAFFEYYELIKNNYDWLKRVPFGATPIISYNNTWYYQPYGLNLQKTVETNPETPSIGAVLVSKNAQRLHPIISKDKSGRPYFAWIGISDPDKTPSGAAGNSAAGLCNWYAGGNNWYTDFQRDTSGGMANSIDGGSLKDIAKRIHDYSSDVHIVPKKPYDEPSWHLQENALGKSPDCLVIHKPGDDPTRQMCLSGMGLDIVFRDGADIRQEHREMLLVPIDYDTVRAAGGQIRSGGVPMWFEPMTENLLAKLHKLGE